MCWKGCLYPVCSFAWISSCLIKSLFLRCEQELPRALLSSPRAVTCDDTVGPTGLKPVGKIHS